MTHDPILMMPRSKRTGVLLFFGSTSAQKKAAGIVLCGIPWRNLSHGTILMAHDPILMVHDPILIAHDPILMPL